ncbi:hypothetical protein LCGC14_1486320 [marine sediment metagenome]|uniref:Uncharacterized protein n=1 Tax=marine sediment metagenome TaxID=412755 RepID=A0A0F9LNQ1_9ZZZZ
MAQIITGTATPEKLEEESKEEKEESEKEEII